MAKEIIMPKLGMSMTEGTVVMWHKKKGDPIKKGEPIVSISSEKIENEVEAPMDGELIEVSAAVDDVVPVGKALGYVGEPGEEVPEQHVEERADISESPQKEQAKSPAATEAAATEKTETKLESSPSTGARKRVSPAAKKLARQHGVDIETVDGTGPQGRIVKEDILKAAEEKQTEPAPPASPSLSSVEKVETKEPTKKNFGGIRKVIAERMHESMQNSAQLTIMRNADVTALITFQKNIRKDLESTERELKVTITDLLAKAVTMALIKHPEMNSAQIDNTIYQYHHVHLGIAAATEKGLVVPVVFHAQEKSIQQLSDAIRTLGHKAKDGTLTTEEMSGSTFTITNLGKSGISFFTPVLNPPEIGILGVGTIEEMAVFQDGEVVPKNKLPLSLTFDHRIIDGEPASRFLDTMIRYLEHPYSLLV